MSDALLVGYSKTVNIATGSSVMTFTDTAGSSIQCDYIKAFIPGSSTLTELVLISPNFAGHTAATTSSVDNSASGALGFYLSPQLEAEFKFPKPVSSINLVKQTSTTSMIVFVTYGITRANNTLKSQNPYSGV